MNLGNSTVLVRRQNLIKHTKIDVSVLEVLITLTFILQKMIIF